jgi:uncharacterized protein (TIGR03437 family)
MLDVLHGFRRPNLFNNVRHSPWVATKCLTLCVISAFALEATTPAPPALPQVFLDTRWQIPTGSSIMVSAGGNLQSAIDSAVPGDEIVLQAGARFTGNFILRAKTGTGRITIRSSQLSSLPEGTRVGPSQVAAMATIVSPNAMAVFATEPAASSYRLAGLEITIQDTVTINYGLVVLGDGSATSLTQLPSDMIVDRSYLHGNSTCNCQRGVAFNGIREAMIDSYISEIHFQGVDSQAICGWAGAGPFKIVNNYLEAAGENIMFGGAPPAITNLIPSDIEIRRNLISKQLAWMPLRLWTVKNLFELKNAQRLLVDGNILQNNWINAQVGFAVLFQGIPQSNTDLWSIVQDVTFTNNIVRHSTSGMNFCGGCWYSSSPDPGNSRVTRVYVGNNLLDDINGSTYDGGTGAAGGGIAFQLLSNVSDLVIEHNTVLNTGNLMILDGKPSPRVRYANTIASHGPWGIAGSGYGSGNPAIAYYLPDSAIIGNLIVALQNGLSPSDYPAGNLFPASMTSVGFTNYNGGNSGNYQLTSSSLYRNTATDGRDPGFDTTALNNALQGTTSTPAQGATVTITSPTLNPSFTTSNSTISLSGTASDSAGITQVTWSTDHGASGTATGTSNWAIAGLAVPSGNTQVTVTARDAAGNQGTAVLAITYMADTVPPTIAISTPTSAASFTTSSSTINLAGTASDNVGVAQVTWATDHGASGTATGTTNWSISGVTVPAGSTQITVTAADTAGNVTSAVLTVTSTTSGSSDPTPPTINITSPTSGSNFISTGNTISLAGTASDNVGVAQVTWATDHGASGTAAGTTSWSISGLVLPSGVTRVTVLASDAAGNIGSSVLAVTYTAPDTTAPSITITAPTLGTTFSTTSTSVVVSGVAADNVGVTQVTWSADRGGSGTASGTTSWSTGSIGLQAGSTQITVVAHDQAGNSASAVLTVTLPQTPDTTAPTISITSPTSSSTFSTTSTSITVSGSASDNVGVTQVTWATDRGAHGVAAGTSSWSAAGVTLLSGSNQITVTATDAAGNLRTTALTVSSSATPSTPSDSVAIISPTTGPVYTTSVDTVNLAGTATGNGGVTEVTWSADRGDGSGTAVGTTSWSVSGVKLKNGSNTITITARDMANVLTSQVIQVNYSPPSVKTRNLPKAEAGLPYSYNLEVSGGVPPYSWSASSLPSGLSLSSDGLITGTPATTGTYDVNFVVQDSSVSANTTLTLSVNPWIELVSPATFSGGWAAPESMLTALGWQLSTGTASAPNGPLQTTLADSTVTVRDAQGVDRLALLYFVSPNQINFVVPAETSSGTATISVANGGRPVISGTIYVSPVAPSMFVVNADNLAAANLLRVRGDVSEYDSIWQLDSTTNQVVAVPADLSPDTDRFYLILYATGLRFRSSVDGVKATVGGEDATVVYAGSANSSDGLDVLNILLPTDLHGWVDVAVTVDNMAANTVRILLK